MKQIMKLLLFCLLLSLMASSVAFSDTFELKSGKIHKGKILDENATHIYLDTPSGSTVSFKKGDVLKHNGEPYVYTESAKTESKTPVKKTNSENKNTKPLPTKATVTRRPASETKTSTAPAPTDQTTGADSSTENTDSLQTQKKSNSSGSDYLSNKRRSHSASRSVR